MSIMSMTCNNPANPYDAKNTKIYIYARSAAGATSSTGIQDSVGNTIYIGCNSNLSSNIDSVQLVYTVKYSGSSKDSFWGIFKDISTKNSSDTLWDSIVFSDSGTKTITGIAYIKNNTTYSSSITATIHSKPVNHKPILTVTGDTTITVAQTCSLTVSVSDVDSLQTHSFSVLKKPLSGSFVNPTFIWKPSSDNIGKDTVIFMVSDNGYPVMSDTRTVVITVSDTGSGTTNHPPVWQKDTINESGSTGSQIKLTLSEACSDADGDSLTYTLLPGIPVGDTIIGGVWSFTPAASDTGTYYAKIVAKDPSGFSDTLFLHLTITATDQQAPVLRFLSPSKDTVIGADSCVVSVICKDASGIDSLKCSVDTVSFTTTKSATADSIYTATVKGLKAGQYSTVKFIATDASSNANKDSLSISIKYDNDITKPSISLVTPPESTVSTNASSYTITLKCTDASGIASVIGVKGSVIDTGTAGTDSTYAITVSNLTQGKYDTVKITVTDKSLRANKATQNIMIKYDSTLEDKDGPTITKISGADTVSSASYTLVDSIYDPSGVDSVYAVLNSGTKTILTGTDNKYTFAGTLSEGLNTIVVTAKDKSTAGNPSTQTKNVLYIVKTVITTDLSAQTACPGTAVSLSVAASGTRPLTYQWYKDNGTTSISSDSIYKISSFTLTDTGYYKVIVSNWSGVDTSASVKLSVTRYTITFNSDTGSSVANQSVICNSTATEPTDPTRSGYQFDGWYTSSSFTSSSAFNFTNTITKNITLYAKWLKLYTVTYNGNGNTGGNVPVDGTSYLNGATVTVLGNTGSLTKTHYTFSKWNTSSDGSGTPYTSGMTFAMGTANVTLYAQWIIDSFTVSFNSQGGTDVTSKKVAYGNAISSFPTAPTKTGCIFSGWYTGTIGTGDSIKTSTTVTTDITLYARWTVKDADGNVYNTVTIGNQTWMAENLRTTKYSSGKSITNVTNSTDWTNFGSTPGYCYYKNTANADSMKKFGALYNWYATDSGILITGWHVPNTTEWETLQNYLIANGYNYDDTKDSNKIAKSMAATTDWASNTTTGAIGNDLSKNNKSGFSAFPGGFRSSNGDSTFDSLSYFGYWWTTDVTGRGGAQVYYYILCYNNGYLNKNYNAMGYGYSVRLLRD
jgi:uncharacterized protein (TIGR02145 family)/uncharacterized repeat protein (TIGR02543 family)